MPCHANGSQMSRLLSRCGSRRAARRWRRSAGRWVYRKPTFYRWKKQFVGMGVPEIRRLKQLEEENGRLKRLVADLTLDRTMLQDVLRRKW